ncbi:MAG TPA: hypothetical protein DIS90_03930 [Cytophagales bacterium]|nr:hypothetical protein [Cytophagales bacterium]
MNLETALSRYKDVHERILPSIISGFTKKNLKTGYLNLNPPLWILWHMARSEDFGINRLACDGTQEFIKNKWGTRLNVKTNRIGTGMSKEEVKEVCEQLNAVALENYRTAVFKNNIDTLSRIQSEDLTTDWNDDYLNNVLFTEGTLDKGTNNILPVYQKKTREWFVVHTLVAHSFYHIGQLSVIKQLTGKN